MEEQTEQEVNPELLMEQELNKQFTGESDLVRSMYTVLANTFSMYLLAHKYHWNVEGPFFSSYHDFFGKLYQQIFEEIDKTAEQIRALGSYAPGTFKEFEMMSTMTDSSEIPESKTMFARLFAANTSTQDSLIAARSFSEKDGNFGLVNYLEDRLDKHAKIGWMLKSHMVDPANFVNINPTN